MGIVSEFHQHNLACDKAIIFVFKNKLDITLCVALGSATQISMFVVPVCVIVSWILGIKMDLNFNLIETGSLAYNNCHSFHITDVTSTYLKGVVLLLWYIVTEACFFVQITPFDQPNDEVNNVMLKPATDAVFRA
ncbi:Vacuolar cation/proton exchanger 3 [Stylosanthes scabra]|uniref:Vacuolar cation/proton exchanger 3 n=1 Tax=Stylosanthes scabra TaxID=79078 RepID=A0ABU6ZK66_9FABA|nr:Vacuolar cation/proton exchanger 3 [Stylosanthes scabra]